MPDVDRALIFQKSSTTMSPVHGELCQKSLVMFLCKCEAFSSLDDVLGSTVTSWMSRRCTLGILLAGRRLKGQHYSQFSLWIMALTVVCWWPKTLKWFCNTFQTDRFHQLCLPTWIYLDHGMWCFCLRSCTGDSSLWQDRLYLSEFLIAQVRVWPVDFSFSNNVVNHSLVMIKQEGAFLFSNGSRTFVSRYGNNFACILYLLWIALSNIKIYVTSWKHLTARYEDGNFLTAL